MDLAQDSRPPRRRRWRRALRVVVALLALVLASLVLLVAVAPLRTAALREGLRRADAALPGTLSVANAQWPRLGRLALTGVVWSDAPDTLLWLGALDLDLSLRPLLRRELDVQAVRIDGLRADVPAIAARFAKPAAETTPQPGPTFSPDALPNVELADLQVTDARVRVAADRELVVPRLRLAADLRGTAGPRTLSLSGLASTPSRPELGVALRLEAALDESLVVRLAPIHLDDPAALPDPESLVLAGRLAATLASLLALSGDDPWPALSLQGLQITGALGDLALGAQLHGREAGTVNGRLTLAPPPAWLLDTVLAAVADSLAGELRPLLRDRWPHEAPPSLSWDAQFTPPPADAGLWPVQAAVTSAFVLPGPSHVSPLLPPQLRVDDLGALRGQVAARYAGAGDSLRVHLDLDLDETAWLRTGRLRADTDGRGWVDVDTLVLALPGLALDLRGRLDREHVDTGGTIDIASAVLARWDDPALAGIEGRFHVGLHASGPRQRPRLRADLAGRAAARGLSLPAVAARASLAGDHLVLDLDAPAGFSYGLTALDTLHVAADVTAHDGRRRFTGEATVTGGGRHGEFSVPQADLHATLDGRHAVLNGVLPRGLAFQDAVVDSLRVDLDVTARDDAWQPREGRLSLTAAGRRGELGVPRLEVLATLDDRHGALTATLPAGLAYGDAVVDSAQVALEMTARQESWLPQSGRLSLAAGGRRGDLVVPRLELAGDLVDSSVVLGVRLPLGLAAGQTHLDSLWCRFAGGFGDSLRAVRGHLAAAGSGVGTQLQLATEIDLQRRDGPPAIRARIDSLVVQQGGRGVVLQRPCSVAFDSRDSLLVIAGLELRGAQGRLGADLRLDPHTVAGNVSYDLGAPMSLVRDLLPEDLLLAADADTITLGGWVRLGGTPADPTGHAVTSLELLDQAGVSTLAARAQAWLGSPRVAPAAEWPAAPADAPVRGVAAEATLRSRNNPLLDVSLRLPWSISLQPFGARPDSVVAGTLAVRTADLDLSLLDDVLPPGNRVRGRLDLDLQASGRPDDWALDGQLALRKVVATFADGSWVDADGEFGVHGDTDSLNATGAITLGSGLLRVPEATPSLLPTTGELMLRAPADTAGTAASLAAAADSLGGARRSRLPLAAAAVRVRIPGNLWLRGRGLNVEIAGDLVVGLRDGRPVVQGDLKALQGNLKLLGHFFTLEHGLVVFMDDAEALDPDLDIRLTTRMGGTRYIVQVVGNVQTPQLELSSEPEMSEEDIVSSLLFGVSSSELDEGQAGMVADRSAQILASYGSVQLQDWASAQLGLDLVSIEPSAEHEDATSLVVGKYIDPKVVIRYEQVMSEESAWYVHLDYLVTSFLKLHSVISEGAESGVEMMWYLDR